MFYGQKNSRSEADEDEAESTSSDLGLSDSSEEYEPSSEPADSDSSSSVTVESESEEETSSDCIPVASITKTWGPCTFQTAKFGFSGPRNPQINITESTPYEIYRYFLTDEMLKLIVEETNRYAQQYVSANQLRRRSLMSKWKDTNAEEIQVFLGIIAIMGVSPLPRLHLYWSKDKKYRNLRIVELMTRERFEMLLKGLHFCNNEDNSSGRLFKIEKILNLAIHQFKQAVTPGQEVVIDETMIPWRGRLSFRQYIPGKAHKYGVKIYKLCTVEGYTWNFKVYCGREEEGGRGNVQTLHSENVVMKLMENLLLAGRTLFVDNFYTSLTLANALLAKQTFMCGTLRQNRKGNPKEVCQKKQKRGDVIGSETENGIRVIKWMDKRPVLMMTTKPEHFDVLIATGRKKQNNEDVLKPQAVLDYNAAKKGVDVSDQMSAYYTCVRKTVKWYKKVFIEIILGTAILNSWYVHSKLSGRKVDILNFRDAVIDEMTKQANESHEEETLPVKARKVPLQRHHLGKHDGPARKMRKRCKNCYDNIKRSEGTEVARKRAKRVSTFCEECEDKPSLCLDCFNKLH